MNEESSRGHAVLLMRASIRRRASDHGPGSPSASTTTRITVADLAGSEDLKLADGWSGGHMPEKYTPKSDFDSHASRSSQIHGAKGAGSIHRSLLCLQRVLSGMALAQRMSRGGSTLPPPRLPWRDSALTQLLCRPLTGGAAVTILACVSPVPSHARLSLRTLRYAAECARIRIEVVPQEQSLDGAGGLGLRSAASAAVQEELEQLRDERNAADQKLQDLQSSLDAATDEATGLRLRES